MSVNRLKRLFRGHRRDRKVTPFFDRTPDQPEPFGYKISWFALKASDPASVIGALELGETTPANWASGLAAVYGTSGSDDHWVFISPPVNGWTLAVSRGWPHPTAETHREIGAKFDVLFNRLIKRFDDVQFFGSYRVSDFASWARALNGKPSRVFAYADGEVLMNFGGQTPEEAALGLVNLTGLSPAEAGEKIFGVAEEQNEEEERLVAAGLSRAEAVAKVRQNGPRVFPDEAHVVNLAALWSIDPTKLEEQELPPGLGRAARLPND